MNTHRKFVRSAQFLPRWTESAQIVTCCPSRLPVLRLADWRLPEPTAAAELGRHACPARRWTEKAVKNVEIGTSTLQRVPYHVRNCKILSGRFVCRELPAMRQQCSSAAQTADPARKRFDRRRNNRSLDRARPSTLARRLIVDRPAWDGRLAIIPKRYVRYILCSVAEFEQAMLLSGARRTKV